MRKFRIDVQASGRATLYEKRGALGVWVFYRTYDSEAGARGAVEGIKEYIEGKKIVKSYECP